METRRGKVFSSGRLAEISLDLIMGTGAALCSVDRSVFKDFVAECCEWNTEEAKAAGLRGLSRRTITDLLKAKYDVRQLLLQDELVGICQPHPVTQMVLGFHIGFDGFSDVTVKEWLALTLSYTSIDGKLRRILGDLIAVTEEIDSATAESMRELLLETFLQPLASRLGSDHSLIKMLRTETADNASAAQAIFKTPDFADKRIGCFDHKGQLCCTDQTPHKNSAGESVEGLSPLLTGILADFRLILNKFAKSNKVMRAYVRKSLELFDNELVMMPIYDVPTRCVIVW